MTVDDFIQTRKGDWERLTLLLNLAEGRSLRQLSEADLLELGRLYRGITSDLAVAQRDYPTHNVTRYLNQLIGRAHPLVYRGEPLIWKRVKEFYLHGYPRLYRELAPFIIVAALLMFGSAVLLYFVTLTNPDAANYFLDPFQIAMIRDGTQWWKDLNQANQMGASVIMTHNITISLYAFAGGLPLGLFTLYVLIGNGIDLGAVFGLLQYYRHAAPLLEFVTGHGVLELSEITMAGGSGLMLGYALLRPGLLSRRDALITAAQKSIQLLLGSIPLLVVAGTIEGFISPSDVIPAFVKYGIGLTTGILLYGYVILAGRGLGHSPCRPGLAD